MLLKKILDALDEAKENNLQLDIDDSSKVLEAVKDIAKDKELIDQALLLVSAIQNQEFLVDRLTQRENEIFGLIGMGFSTKDIASLTSISELTVSTHRKKIIKKLQLSGTGQLQKMAFQYTYSKLSN